MSTAAMVDHPSPPPAPGQTFEGLTPSAAKSRATHQFPCPTCGDAFSRVDHLSRHLRSHNAERTFLCNVCGKGFTRADSLSRHARGHEGGKSPQSSSCSRNLIARVPTACQKCSISKLRCDGSQPCKRCSDKDLHCTYVKRSRRRVKEGQLLHTSRRSSNAALEHRISSPPPQNPQVDTIMLHQDAMDSIDARALDALSQAALQARTPPLQDPTVDGQPTHATTYPGSHSPNPGNTFLRQAVGPTNNLHACAYETENENYEPPFGPLSPPISNTNNGVDGSWTTHETLNHMSFDVPTPDRHDDRTSEVSSIENLAFDPLWDTTFDITNWTTLEYDFQLDMTPSFPQPDIRHDSTTIQQLSNPTTFVQMRPSNPTNSLFLMAAQDHHSTMQPPDQSNNTLQAQHQIHLPGNGSSDPTPRIANTTNTSHPPPIGPDRERDVKDADNNMSSTSLTRHDPDAHQGQWPTDWEPGKSDNVLSFPDLQGISKGIFDAENFSHVPQVSQRVYDSILRSIDQTSRDQTLFRAFLDSDPPSLEALNCFVQLYFEHFQPVFPLLHQPTFDPSSAPWILVLAVAAIGCRYSKVKDSAKCATVLEELLRRAIQHACEGDNSISRKLWLAQAMALNMLGMLYSGDKRLLELALVSKGGMVTTCSRNNSLKGVGQTNKIDENLRGRPLESAWKLWLREESYRRLGFCCWLLDCQLPLYFDTNPSMGMHEVQQQLPCKEGLWEAANEGSWKPLFLQSGSSLTMHSALQALSSQEKLSPAIGDFGRLILTHAVYMTTWEMRQQAKNPLLQRTPFLTGDDMFVAWQSIATSTLDILLPSDQESAQSSVLRLNMRAHVHHVALLVHVPLSSLLAYARSQAANHGIQKAQQELVTWIKEDNGRTARHAVLHAAILFSLIREQPSRGFHEPIALLIATLTIWAFHELSRRQSPSMHSREFQATIRLDRAYRTQSAVSWVENGGELRGYLTDVGNICGPGAGKRLLQLSCRSLMAMNAWTLSQGFLQVLSTLQMSLSDLPCG